jgi:glycosyltransferase involved in cell wall biosynthesis
MKIEKPAKIRVLRILNRFNVGGPVWNVALLTKYLPEEYETKLVGGKATSNEADAQGILDELAIKAQIIPSLSREVNVYNDVKSFRVLRKIIQEFKPHVVHTHASKAGFLGRLAAFTTGVPIVIHTYHGHVFEGYFGPIKTEIIRKLERMLARKTTAIVTISLSQKEAITKKYNICPLEKTHVIPLGFDLIRFYPNEPQRAMAREAYHLENDTIAVCIVGRLTAIKNHPLFLKAAAILHANSSLNYRFFVVGDGETKAELRQLCLENGIESQVVFTSWIHSMERFYPAMDIVCLTSLNEGTPVTLIEAQASGIPVISTNVGGVANTMIDGQSGLILTSFSPEELAEKIERLARDTDQRRQMSKNAHTFASEHFSYQALVKNMDALYQKLLKDV